MLNSKPGSDSSLFHAVLAIFIPSVISLAASAAISILDIYLAGLLGSAEQAAIGMADQVLFLVTMGGAGLATACVAHVAREEGAQDIRSSRLFARDCVLLSLVGGLFAAAVCLFLGGPIIGLLHSDAETTALATKYAIYNAPANAAYTVALCLVAIMRAIGRPRIGLLVWAVMSAVTMVLSLVFFFVGPAPLRSLEGLGIAWDIGSFVGTATGAVLFLWLEPDFRASFVGDYSGTATRLKRVIATAIPAITAELAPISSNFAIYRILSDVQHSEAAQAAWTIRMKLEEVFATMPLAALAMAIAVVVGQNLGADRMDRARKCGVIGCAAAVLAMLPLGTVLSGMAGSVVNTFSTDALTCNLSVILLAPFNMILPAMALSQVFCGCLDGAAFTKLPMGIHLIGLVAVRCGLAYAVVAAGRGVNGLAEAALVSQICTAVLAAAAFVYVFRPVTVLGPVVTARECVLKS